MKGIIRGNEKNFSKNYIGWWPGADAAEDLPAGMNYTDWDAYKQSGWLGKGAIIHDLDMNYREETTGKTSYFGPTAWPIHIKLFYNWKIGTLFGPMRTNGVTKPNSTGVVTGTIKRYDK